MKIILCSAILLSINHCHKNYHHQTTKKDLIGNWKGVDSGSNYTYHLRIDTDTIYVSIGALKSKNYYQLKDSNKIIVEDTLKGQKITRYATLEFVSSDTIIYRMKSPKARKLTMYKIN
jgi:hypothetical protein